MSNAEQGGDEFLIEFLDDYFAESDEHLTAIRRILLQHESRTGPLAITPASVEELFRSFHSLKGLSGMVHLRPAELVAHHLESCLRRLRTDEAALSPDAMDALIEGTDLLERVIGARRLGKEPPAIERVAARLSALSESQPGDRLAPANADTAQANSERWVVRFVPSPQLAERGVNVDRVRAQLREHGEITAATPVIEPGGGISFEFHVSGHIDP